MVVRTKMLGAVVLLVVAALWWSSGGGLPGGDNDDRDRRRVIELIAKSSQDVIYLDADAVSNQLGVLVRYKRARKMEPWLVTIVAEPHERVDADFTVYGIAPRTIGAKVSVSCEILVDGVRKDFDRDERVVRDPDDRTVQVSCAHSS